MFNTGRTTIENQCRSCNNVKRFEFCYTSNMGADEHREALSVVETGLCALCQKSKWELWILDIPSLGDWPGVLQAIQSVVGIEEGQTLVQKAFKAPLTQGFHLCFVDDWDEAVDIHRRLKSAGAKNKIERRSPERSKDEIKKAQEA